MIQRPPLNWKTAFFVQARSDYQMFLRLTKADDVPLCHKLHYLQMATEKLAKGFTTRDDLRPPRTHIVFASLIRLAQRDKGLQRLLGRNTAEQVAVVKSILPVAEAIEALAPVGDIDRPSPEYPWEHEGVIYAPVGYTYHAVGGDRVDLRLDAPRTRKLLQFVQACFDLIEE